jgi:glycosyltransferase involved in cell wall biosynthesis
MSSPLRVLHVIPAIWEGSGGPTRAVIEMSRALRAADPSAHVEIATTDFRLSEEWLARVRARLTPQVPLHVFPESRWLDAGWSFSLARWLWTHVARFDVVHIHALLNSTSAVAARIARLRGVPYVIRPLGTLSPYTFGHRRRLLKRVYHALVDRPVVQRAAAVHFTAPQEATKAGARAPAGTSTVIPIPYELPSSGRPTRRPGMPGVVLFMGRLHPVKGLDLLLAAVADVRSRGIDTTLVVAGDGPAPYTEWVQREVERLGMRQHVEFTGFVEGAAKRALYARADVFALPSRQENFGVAIVEALAEGLPVVISREVDIWPDIVRFDSGIVTPCDVAPLSHALGALLTRPERRAAMAASGPRQVAELYAPPVVGAQLHALYARAAGRVLPSARAASDAPPSQAALLDAPAPSTANALAP